MTAVLGLVDSGRVWMGADSATTWEGDSTRVAVTANPKVFRVGQFLIGSAGSGRTQRVARHGWTPPPRRKQPLEQYVSISVVDSLRRAMLDAGVAEKKDNVEDSGGDFLVGYRGHLFRIDEDYNVDEAREPFEAVGCGAVAALAGMHGLSRRARGAALLPPKQRVVEALRIAERLSWGVRGPFTVEVL